MNNFNAKVIAGIAALGLVSGSVGVSAAQGGGVPTSLTLVEFADSNSDGMSDYIIGRVASSKSKCVDDRTVSIIRRSNQTVIDRARTSKNGYWAGGGVEEINSIEGRVTVARKVVGRGGNRVVCKAVSELFD